MTDEKELKELDSIIYKTLYNYKEKGWIDIILMHDIYGRLGIELEKFFKDRETRLKEDG